MTSRSRSGLCAWIIQMTSCWCGCFDPQLFSREKKIKDTPTQTLSKAVSLPPVRKDFQTESEYAKAYVAWSVVAEEEAAHTQSSDFKSDGIPVEFW